MVEVLKEGDHNNAWPSIFDKKQLDQKENMNVARYSHSLSAIADILVAVGGFDKNADKVTKSCEVFLRQEEKWSPIADLNQERYEHAACV